MNQDFSSQALDVQAIRAQFPILNQHINDHPLIYLDNAATTQKPLSVIEAMSHYYLYDNANVHRGIHGLSMRATQAFEAVRDKVQRFIHAKASAECIFVKGATEGINLVAHSFVAPRLFPGEEVLITYMEHHSNIVPWQMACRKAKAILKAVPVSVEGELSLEAFEEQLTENTKFVAISHASNALGTINPVKEMIAMAHAKGAMVLVDGAQAAAHLPIDVQDLDCDFYVFSGHKMYGPTGVGVLWGRQALLDDMVPYQGGGEMINQVSIEAAEYSTLPYKFEAGTPNIAGVIGLGAALDFLWSLDLAAISAYENYLLDYATTALEKVSGFNIIGRAKNKVPIISFVHGKIHPHDVGTLLDTKGIAIRSGHHCAMPLMDWFDVPATCRISLSFYNTKEEIDTVMKTLEMVKEVLL